MFLLFVLGILIIVIGFVCLGKVKGIKGWKMNGKIIVTTIIGIMIISTSCFRQVPTGHTGIVTIFGEVQNETLEAGVHMLMPWKSVIIMDNRTQKGTQQLSCFSSDIQEVEIVYTINYQINKSNAQEIYKTIGTSYYDVVIVPRIQDVVKTVTAKYTAENLISARAELGTKIQDELTIQLSKYNIELIGASIENMDFTDAFTTAVEEKQVAEQNKLKAQTQKEQAIIESEAKAQTKIIEAEAEAKANDLLEKSLTKNILEQRFLDKWNGELPKVTGSEGSILDVSSIIGSTETKTENTPAKK